MLRICLRRDFWRSQNLTESKIHSMLELDDDDDVENDDDVHHLAGWKNLL